MRACIAPSSASSLRLPPANIPGRTMALFDDLTKKAAKFTEKTIEKSSEFVDTTKTKVSIKSAEADLDDQFIELGKLYYEVLNKDNVFDEKAAPVVQKIDEINQRIESLKSNLEKE